MAKKIARGKARCDYALMMGASASNAKIIPKFAFDVSGLKMYLNDTFTTLRFSVRILLHLCSLFLILQIL